MLSSYFSYSLFRFHFVAFSNKNWLLLMIYTINKTQRASDITVSMCMHAFFEDENEKKQQKNRTWGNQPPQRIYLYTFLLHYFSYWFILVFVLIYLFCFTFHSKWIRRHALPIVSETHCLWFSIQFQCWRCHNKCLFVSENGEKK